LQINTNKKDVLWSYLGYFFNLGVNVVLLPVILRYLSREELGIWYTFTGIYSLVILVDFGFSTTFVRNLTYAWSGVQALQTEGFAVIEGGENPNIHLYQIIYQTTKKILFYLSLAVLIIMLTLGSAYILYVTKEINNRAVLIAFFIYSAGGAANIFFNYRIIALKSIGAYAGAQQALVLSRIVQLAVSGIGIVLGGGLIILAVSYFLSGLVMRVAAKHIFEKYEQVKLFLRCKNIPVSKAEVKKVFLTLWANIKKAGVVTVSMTILNQSGTLLCSAFAGIAETAVYGLCLQLNTVLCGIGKIFYETNVAPLTNAKINYDISKQQNIFSAAIVFLWTTVILGVFSLSVLGPFLLSAIGSNTGLRIPVFIIMGIYLLIESNCAVHWHFISLDNTYPFVNTCIAAVVFQIIAFLCLIFSHNINLMSILAVNFITRIIFMGIKWPGVCLDRLNLNFPRLIKTGFIQIYDYLQEAYCKRI
jgi:hypothetical protein